MALNKAYNQYQQTSVNTSSPEELTLMLYNGLIKYILLAIHAVDEKDIEKTNTNIIRAQDIILEFQGTLDMKYPVAQNMMALYDYMYSRLIEANLKKDKAMLEEVLGFAKEFRDTWTQAMKLAKHQAHNPVPNEAQNTAPGAAFVAAK